MTRKSRRILFIIAIVAFAAIGFVMIMYAQGYRWDFKNNKLLLSGAIYVEPISPDKTNISINNKPADSQSAALVKNLVPLRKYQVKVTKADYQTWEKEFEVEPGFVVQAENVVLFPAELKTQIILPDKTVTDFTISPDEKLLATRSGDKILTLRFIAEPSATATPINFADKKKTLAAGFLKNGESWSANSKKFMVWRDVSGQRIWYLWDNETRVLTNLTSLYERKIILKNPSASPWPVKFNPIRIKWLGNDNDLGVILDGKLLRLDLKNEAVTDLNLSDIVDFDFKDSKIVALKNSGILMLMDSAIQNVSVLGQTNTAPNRVFFSPETDKVLYANNNTLGVLWLNETSHQPLKKINDIETIYETTGTITDAYWHNSGEYIVLLENQNLKTVELDSRGRHNIASWPSIISVINYLPKEQKLFLLENGDIKSADGEF